MSLFHHVALSICRSFEQLPLLFILYTSALSTISITSRHVTGIHLYVDDTQLYVRLQLNEVAIAIQRLLACIDDIMLMSLSMRLKLNPTKFESIWFDRSRLQQFTELLLSSSSSLQSPSSTVRDLGVTFDSTLSLRPKIAVISMACLFNIRGIRQLRSTIALASVKH